MMTKSSLLQRNVSNTGGRSPSFQPSGAGGSFFSELSRGLEQTSNEMKAKSDNLYINSFMTDARKSARDIYNKNSENPEQLSKELNKYKQGLLGDMPAALRPRLDSEYGSLGEQYLNKATASKNKQLNLQQNIALQDNENQILSDINFATRDIFSESSDLTEAETVTRNITSINSIASSFQSLESNLAQVGADGTPLRSPTQTVKSLQKAKEFFFTGAADSWFDSQPDKLAAINKWQSNEVTIPLPEGNINVRDAMSPGVRAKVDKTMMDNFKNDIYIENKQAERIEAQQEIFADETKKILYKMSEDGNLSPNQVEASKNVLDYNAYKDFRRMAREANPITNGTVYGGLIRDIQEGKDVSNAAEIARFTNKTISNEDYEKILNRNKVTDGKKDIPDPVDAGRDFLLGSLGSNSTILGLTQAANIASAERDYDDSIQSFIDKEGRSPNRAEATNIADEFKDKYLSFETDKIASSLPKPKAMPLSVKIKGEELTEEAVDKVKVDTFNTFMKKHNNDIDKVKVDPDFITEIKLIQPFRTIAIKKDAFRAKAAAKKRK